MMSHQQYVCWLVKNATGWLGWTPDQALDCDMTDTELAIEGKREMLKACFGSPEKPGPQKITSVEAFDRAFG